jgi:DNA-binding MarR family transcriptional regulator
MAARRITAVFERSLRAHGLRAGQFTILTNLMLRGETAVSALARTLAMDRTTLTRNMALLEERGWLKVQTDPVDARSHTLSVTAKGQALVAKALPDWRRAQASVSATIGAGGVAAMQRLSGTAIE